MTPELTGARLPIGGTPVQVRIAAAAIDLFYSRGAVATTVRDITAACGLTPGALYNHFTSKEQLLYVLVRDIHLQVDALLDATLAAAPPDPAIRLAAAVKVLVAQTAGSRKQARVANRDYITLTGEMRGEIIGLRRRLRSRLTEILLDGCERGAFVLPGQQDRTTAAHTATVIASLCATISEWTQENYPVSVPDLQDRYAQMALRIAGWPAG